MQRRWMFAVLLACSVVGTSVAQNDCDSKSTTEILSSALASAKSIEVGATRTDVEKNWGLDGGLQFLGGEARYVFRQCSMLKIKIKFATSKDSSDRPVWAPNDLVKSVSGVYVERMFMD